MAMTIVNNILKQMPAVGQPQRMFLVMLFSTILALRGRVNFRNLSRYCDYSERTIARQFRRSFDWPDFHQRIITTALDPQAKVISAQDASFIPKSGKQTFGLGHFFNGCAGRAERGLEISTLAVVDLRLHPITKLLGDADCRFLFTGPHPTRRGAHRKYDGKVHWQDLSRFEALGTLAEAEHVHLYTAVVWHVTLKRKLRVVVLINRQDPATPRYLVLASTDLALDGHK